MNNGIYVICAVLLLSAVTLGGCGAQSQERMDHAVIEETPDGGMRISDESSYEYEIQELSAWRDENQIYGVAYIPQMETEQMPAVIYAHGYGATHQNGIQYAEKLAERGFVVYCFDFCGGSTSSQSDGSTLEMSVFTEQADLETVIEMVGELEYVDSSHVFLLWASQGGGPASRCQQIKKN